MIKFFAKPYPMQEVGARDLFVALSAGLFVVLFLLDLRDAAASNDVEKIIGFGLATSAVVLINAFLIKGLLYKALHEEEWTVGKQLIWYAYLIAVVTALNYYYASWLGVQLFFYEHLALNLLFGLFLLGVFLFFSYKQLKKKHIRQAGLINSLLQPYSQSDGYTLAFAGPDGGEVEIPLRELLFIKKRGQREIEANYLEHGNIKKAELKGSFRDLKKAEALQRGFARIHRKYYANLNNVEFISASASGFQLKFYLSNEKTPLGGKYQKPVLRFLKSKKNL